MEPYSLGLVKRQAYARKRQVTGGIVAVLEGRLEERGLRLIQPVSRVLQAGSIHELIGTDEPGAGPGATVDRIAYLGFFEVKGGGVVVVGDSVSVGGKYVGKVVGFDETHMPNHQNVVISMVQRASGADLGVRLGSRVVMATENVGTGEGSSFGAETKE